jgi:hypothetical protein
MKAGVRVNRKLLVLQFVVIAMAGILITFNNCGRPFRHHILNEANEVPEQIGDGDDFPQEIEKIIVLYNRNAPDAEEIANYYANARAIPAKQICAVSLPPGYFAKHPQLLAARDEILEECICELIPAADRPSPCDISKVSEIAEVSPVNMMAIIRGIPTRLHDTGLVADNHMPSFDFYLSYMIYRDEDIFDDDDFRPDQEEFSYKRFNVPFLPRTHKFLAYARIEGITKESTFDLIDRSIVAEANGFQGNVVSEDQQSFEYFQGFTSTFAPQCESYITYEPFVFGAPESSWPWQECRAGTTWTTINSPDVLNGQVPGEKKSLIPKAVNVGLLMGRSHYHNWHQGFDGFDAMINWHKTEENCTELCRDFPTAQEQTNCRNNSTDFFRQLNTDCVGTAPGFIGWQYRSYPVQYMAFLPSGWETGSDGALPKSPSYVMQGDSYKDATFTDDSYLHFGMSSVDSLDNSECYGYECKEEIVMFIKTVIELPRDLTVSGIREFDIKFRVRNQETTGGDISSNLIFYNDNEPGDDNYYTTGRHHNISGPNLQWTEFTRTHRAEEDERPFAHTITRIALQLRTLFHTAPKGFLDLDGIELIDVETGTNFLDPQIGSFNYPYHEQTDYGDWAANVIERFGGVAFWGSAGHHITNGHAFNGTQYFLDSYFRGVNLSQSVINAGNAMSGIVYGDPLLRPVAVGLYHPTLDEFNTAEGRTVTKFQIDSFGPLLVRAFNGAYSIDTVKWQIDFCPSINEKTCIASDWSVVERGIGARNDRELHWANYINQSKPQDYVFRLKVWNQNKEHEALFDYARIQYLGE